MKPPIPKATWQILGPALLAATAAGCLDSAGESEPKQAAAPLIFGSDNRVDYGDMDAQAKRWTESVAVGMIADFLCDTDCHVPYLAFTYMPLDDHPDYELCNDARNKGELILKAAQGTAFLVGPDLVMTAGHTVPGWPEPYCTGRRYVFGATPENCDFIYGCVLPSSDVYDCVDVVDGQYTPESDVDPDWAVLRLDRVVAGRTPLIVNYSGMVATGVPVAAIGYPNGLLPKMAINAVVKALPSTDPWFRTNLDVYTNNSGSPVLNLLTGVVEGIHRGKDGIPHYVEGTFPDGRPCSTDRYCSDTDGCPGWSTEMPTRPAARHLPLHTALVMATIH